MSSELVEEFMIKASFLKGDNSGYQVMLVLAVFQILFNNSFTKYGLKANSSRANVMARGTKWW